MALGKVNIGGGMKVNGVEDIGVVNEGIIDKGDFIDIQVEVFKQNTTVILPDVNASTMKLKHVENDVLIGVWNSGEYLKVSMYKLRDDNVLVQTGAILTLTSFPTFYGSLSFEKVNKNKYMVCYLGRNQYIQSFFINVASDYTMTTSLVGSPTGDSGYPSVQLTILSESRAIIGYNAASYTKFVLYLMDISGAYPKDIHQLQTYNTYEVHSKPQAMTENEFLYVTAEYQNLRLQVFAIENNKMVAKQNFSLSSDRIYHLDAVRLDENNHIVEYRTNSGGALLSSFIKINRTAPNTVAAVYKTTVAIPTDSVCFEKISNKQCVASFYNTDAGGGGESIIIDVYANELYLNKNVRFTEYDPSSQSSLLVNEKLVNVYRALVSGSYAIVYTINEIKNKLKKSVTKTEVKGLAKSKGNAGDTIKILKV